MGALIAGTKIRGEFEDRLRSMLKEIDDALDAKVVEFSSEAQRYDITPEITGRQFLNLIMKK